MRTNKENIEENSGLIKVAIDMHLRSCSVVRRIGRHAPQPAEVYTQRL